LLVLSDQTQSLIESEMRLGRKLKEIEAIIDRVIRKASRRYRYKIADDAAKSASVPKDLVRKRSRIIPVKERGRKRVAGLSYFAVFLPVAVLSPTQDESGVKAQRGLSYPRHFIAEAQKFGGGGRRSFVFVRKTSRRSPLLEARVQLYQALALAVDRFEPELYKFVNEEIIRELSRIKD
jgi:hypothetical protein